MGMITSILYIFLFASAGYLVGILIQLHKGFLLIIPTILFGGLILDGIGGDSRVIVNVTMFFGEETSFILFICKIVIVSSFLLLTSLGISNRMEVRK